MNLVIHTDGGARGNPGPAAVGIVIEQINDAKKSVEILGFGEKIGETTNNVAEYTAVIEALKAVFKLHTSDGSRKQALYIQFYLDSTLVVQQLNGVFKIKQPHLMDLMLKVRQLEQELGGTITYAVVRREFNKRADYFVNKALDE